MLGNGRLEAQCIDGVKRLCHIRGKMRKKVWVNAGDVVLLGLREFQDAKADVILKYQADEARSLKAYGELPESSAYFLGHFFLWVGGGGGGEGEGVAGPLALSLFRSRTRSRSHTLTPTPTPPVRVNEADAFADEENQDEYFDFEDVAAI